MELQMSDDTNDDLNDAVGEIVTKNVPQFVTAFIALFGLVAAYFMTIGDMKVKDAELSQRVVYLEQKVDHIESTMDTIKNKLEERVPVVDADRQDLRKELDSLKELMQQMRPLLKR